MSDTEPNRVWHRNAKTPNESCSHTDNRSGAHAEDLKQWLNHVQKVKVKTLGEAQDQHSQLLDNALAKTTQHFSQVKPVINGDTPNHRHRVGGTKVFVDRPSLLDELFEINHARSIYHMFVAVFIIFYMTTLLVNYIEQGRLVLELDLLFYAFGKLGMVACAWLGMFVYTLVVPYYLLRFWGTFYHSFQSKVLLSLGASLVLAAMHACVLGVFPVFVVVHNQMPPASRFIVIVEQIRFLMKSYSFIRETAPVIMKSTPKQGEPPRFPSLSSYLYFLFCPTLLFRESYPRNTHIRWKYVADTTIMSIGSLLYTNVVLMRLCVPVFKHATFNLFVNKQTFVLAVFHSVLPGIMILLLSFFAFLHCWLNLFGELLRFADRMFYKDWWNANSFASYYRTWNVVVHDWLYNYGYRDFLWLTNGKFRTTAAISVFIVSAIAHEYVFGLSFGFFYPVLLFLFGIVGVLFNFVMNDKHQTPLFNIIIWMALLTGQGLQVCLYSLEWYAQIQCPRTGNTFWELVTPRSWICNYPN
ncbi:sterol O-acyltransferase 2 [Thalassophryne amazonica]|uniref:sterol O-acyltransferase 2 n=1 Tax=Thalassophryne amazonica TaxID=390379 RepID=UPI001470CD43|nr:sterol O-acyltransferase 2 [Thalassophryne amazonica]